MSTSRSIVLILFSVCLLFGYNSSQTVANPSQKMEDVSTLKSEQPKPQTVTVKTYMLKKTLADLEDKGCKIESVVYKGDDEWEITYYPPEIEV